MIFPRTRAHALIADALAGRAVSAGNLKAEEWESIWTHARTHCLIPYLHHLWSKAGMLAVLPPPVAARFETARIQNTERNRQILLELDHLCSVLQDQGIPSLVLKGLPVTQEYYGDLGLRVLYDMDLLIRAEDTMRATALLQADGYAPYFSSPHRSDLSNLLWRPKEYAWDAERVFDPARPVFLELHALPWQASWHGFQLDCTLDLWTRSRIQEIGGARLRVPSEEQLLVQLCVHYAFNVLESNARLMHLLDVALLIRSRGRRLDWAGVVRDIDQNGVDSFCFVTLDLARRMCEIELPESVWQTLREATPRRIVRWLGERGVAAAHAMSMYQRDRSLIYFLHWAMAGSWGERARVLVYSVLNPWREGTGSGRWKLFARRMTQRVSHLIRGLRAFTF